MPIQTDTHTLTYRLTLVRHYDDQLGTSVDAQCGTVAWYETFLRDLAKDSLEADMRPDGSNKFLACVTLHIYGYTVPYEQRAADGLGGPLVESFCCLEDGGSRSHIDVRYLGIAALAYRFPASVSHEFGHAHHFWAGWMQNPTWGAAIREFWERQVATRHNSMAEGGAPWGPGWNTMESYANAFRCRKGVRVTRGIPDVPPGMEGGDRHPEWDKQMNLLSDLCDYAAAYGIRPGSLSWQGGSDGCFQFDRADGTRVRHQGRGQWLVYTSSWNWWRFSWVGAWVTDAPRYMMR